MRIVWSTEATRSLRQIVAYIAQDSPVAARKVAARLLHRQLLPDSPEQLG